MASRRQQRLAELIHEEISKLLQFEIRDPRIGFATVTGVNVSPDLKTAAIHVSIMAGDEKEALLGLNSAIPFCRRELSRRVKLRHTPELRFELDRSSAYAHKIDALLSEIDIPPEEETTQDE